MRKNNQQKDVRSTTSPRENRKACLCKNGTYSRKCCKGKIINQGIGNI